MPETGFHIHALKNRVLGTAWVVLLLVVLTSSLRCYSADVVLIRSVDGQISEQHELEVAAQFYGLNLKVIMLSGNNDAHVLTSVQRNDTLAVAIEASALAQVNEKALLRALDRRLGSSVPLLILGVTSNTNPVLLSGWSSGAIVGTHRLGDSDGLRYFVGAFAGVTRQLTGLEIPFPGNDTFYFVLAEHGTSSTIMSVRNDHQAVPVFIEANLRREKVFLLCRKEVPHGRVERIPNNTESAFAEIAPFLIFTKYSAGDRGWHAPEHYANLTIDDPWLREPYGHLVYNDLLMEMEKHNFHTTIAFIPWNYDRSQGPVVALFRSHPERFSICVHGDNHDHKEFDDFGSKPLSLQAAAIKQSLARMQKFETLTGIPYDNVFVFPHNIGSEAILEELKTYNFAATVNSLNVPMDRTPSLSLLFALRPVTLSFGNFPSITRYSAAMTNSARFIAISDFLDNPLLFYGHHELFANGIDAFDGVADEVNTLQPDTRWRSLGEIAKHLYLVRTRDDSNDDVLAFVGSIDLHNTVGRTATFYIQKEESGRPPIASVNIDGQQAPFQLQGAYLRLRVVIPAGESRSIEIRYKNDLNLALISTSKDSLRVTILRRISDFRDITLSRYSIGEQITRYYYKDKLSPLIVILCGFMAMVFSICSAWSMVVIMKRWNAVVRADTSHTSRAARATTDGCTRS